MVDGPQDHRGLTMSSEANDDPLSELMTVADLRRILETIENDEALVEIRYWDGRMDQVAQEPVHSTRIEHNHRGDVMGIAFNVVED